MRPRPANSPKPQPLQVLAAPLPSEFVAGCLIYPSGAVGAGLDSGGDPEYKIVSDQATGRPVGWRSGQISGQSLRGEIMTTSRAALLLFLLVAALAIVKAGAVTGQDPLPSAPVPTPGGSQYAPSGAPGAPFPQSPDGVEVLSRGPVHEAFATPTTEPAPAPALDKRPPAALEETPPAEKPEGNAIWIPGYWAWDDERRDYLWVSGTWRTPPPGKHWVAGYWKEDTSQWRWVPGFWTVGEADANGTHQVTYLPNPPTPPNAAPPGEPPTPDSFFVPGHWEWHAAGTVIINGAPAYRDAGYGWVAGYWVRVQPGYVWIAAHYRWTPSGFIYIPGYWDLAVSRRGFLYAPVNINVALVGPGFVYTPAYAVPPAVVIDALWVRPCYCHYYFGDYYGTVYAGYGFESCVVYSRRCYDPLFVYAVYEHRDQPRWASIQFDVCIGRAAGRYPCPPRTLVEQVRVGYRGPGLVVSARIGEVAGVRTVRLENRDRMEAMHHAAEVRRVSMERSIHEVRPPGGALTAPRTAGYRLAATPPGAKPAAAPPPHPAIDPRRKQPEKKRPDPHDRPQ